MVKAIKNSGIAIIVGSYNIDLVLVNRDTSQVGIERIKYGINSTKYTWTQDRNKLKNKSLELEYLEFM